MGTNAIDVLFLMHDFYSSWTNFRMQITHFFSSPAGILSSIRSLLCFKMHRIIFHRKDRLEPFAALCNARDGASERSRLVNYKMPRVTFQWMIDERSCCRCNRWLLVPSEKQVLALGAWGRDKKSLRNHLSGPVFHAFLLPPPPPPINTIEQ